jgi:hypothetical protein
MSNAPRPLSAQQVADHQGPVKRFHNGIPSRFGPGNGSVFHPDYGERKGFLRVDIHPFEPIVCAIEILQGIIRKSASHFQTVVC